MNKNKEIEYSQTHLEDSLQTDNEIRNKETFKIEYPIEEFQKETDMVIFPEIDNIAEMEITLSNFEISRHVSPLLDAEALRVMKLFPKWDPGYKNGQPVRTAYSVPLSFALSE